MQTTKMFYWYGKLQPRDVATKVTFITPLSSLTARKSQMEMDTGTSGSL
jgi:hypothetical protein